MSKSNLTAGEWLKEATAQLEKTGISTARLDALVLLSDLLNKDKAYILAHSELPLSLEAIEKINAQLKRRANHEPIAYIRSKTEFYGREFLVNEAVLEPRPESEAMIDLLLKGVKNQELRAKGLIVDVGTGSGCLAITAKLELPTIEVMAIDIDKHCLKVAQQNARTHGTKITFLRGDLLEPLSQSLAPNPVLSLLANLPYVPERFKLNRAAMNEPKIAIFGGADGLDIYRRLFEQIQSLKKPPKFVLTESMPPQHQKLAQIAKKSGYRLKKTSDFIQLFSK